MPLFGSHKHTTEARPVGTVGTTEHLGQHDASLGAPGTTHHVGADPMHTGKVGHGKHHAGMPPVADPSLTAPTRAHAADAYPGTAAAGGVYPADVGPTGSLRSDPATAGIPPAAHVSHGAGHRGHERGGSGSSFSGKVERTVGSMIGSQSLKQKGMMKEQEARALQAQSQELQAAENLEREASLRRERAVAHGAHPDNRHLGGSI